MSKVLVLVVAAAAAAAVVRKRNSTAKADAALWREATAPPR
jgi:hypothetical protein